MKTPCRAAISDDVTPIPGAIRCGRFQSKDREDGFCGQHGKYRDTGRDVQVAVDDAPSIRQLYDHWADLTIPQKQEATILTGARHPDISMGKYYPALYLVSWEMTSA